MNNWNQIIQKFNPQTLEGIFNLSSLVVIAITLVFVSYYSWKLYGTEKKV